MTIELRLHIVFLARSGKMCCHMKMSIIVHRESRLSIDWLSTAGGRDHLRFSVSKNSHFTTVNVRKGTPAVRI